VMWLASSSDFAGWFVGSRSGSDRLTDAHRSYIRTMSRLLIRRHDDVCTFLYEGRRQKMGHSDALEVRLASTHGNCTLLQYVLQISGRMLYMFYSTTTH
jgi:hypothetical protein